MLPSRFRALPAVGARAGLTAALFLLAACATRPFSPLPMAPAARAPVPADAALVAEAWRSPPDETDELDSLAAWQDEDGRLWLYATAKRSERLVVFDAASGQRVGTAGGPGTGPGRFGLPNGIAAFGDLLFVVERGNRRVQALSLPELRPLGSFGQERLRVPYGLWLHEHAPGELTVLVTDSYMADFERGVAPPPEQLDERVKRFRVRLDEDSLRAEDAGAFGDTGEGALHRVESIAGDPAGERLLIAEEDRRAGPTLRQYSLDGRWLGRDLPVFEHDAEGVVLWECGAGTGYWIAVEQSSPTRFHVFERNTLAPAGRFAGPGTAATDGVALFAAPSPGFPHGALFALDRDRAVNAFDLRDVARALRLAPGCAR